MAKKIALFISLVMIFSLSFVFASEDTSALIMSAPTSGEENIVVSGESEEIPSGEISGEISGEVSGEVSSDVSGETSTPTTSGEENVTAPSDFDVDSNKTTPSTDKDVTNEQVSSSKNSTIVGAIIAIVIVVAVVAIVAVIQKK